MGSSPAGNGRIQTGRSILRVGYRPLPSSPPPGGVSYLFDIYRYWRVCPPGYPMEWIPADNGRLPLGGLSYIFYTPPLIGRFPPGRVSYGMDTYCQWMDFQLAEYPMDLASRPNGGLPAGRSTLWIRYPAANGGIPT